MRIYTVHVPAAAGSGALAFERAAFVRDGFYVFAFLFSIFWCLWRGLWISALAILALGVAVVGVSRFVQLPSDAVFWSAVVLALLLGFEAANLLRLKLRRRGYVDAGSVAADNLDDAEAIFFARVADEMVDTARYAQRGGPMDGASSRGKPSGEDVVGLFPEYQGR